jgi:hypothetical protein
MYKAHTRHRQGHTCDIIVLAAVVNISICNMWTVVETHTSHIHMTSRGKLLCPMMNKKLQGVSFLRSLSLYWTCTRKFTVYHVYVHVQVMYMSKMSNPLRKLTPWSFLFIIGHNNLPLDVMCIWCVCAAVRLSAFWCRIAVFASYMTMFNTGSYKVHTMYEQSFEWMFCVIWRHTKYILVLLVIAMFIMCMYQHKT